MESILKTITEKYSLTLDVVEKVTQGYLTDNHILTDGATKYFLKKYRFTDRQRIQEIHNAKKYFSEGGIPVILPIVALDSETFFECEKSFYTLFPFVYDRQIEWNKLNEVAITSYAETLAQIHKLGSKSTLDITVFNTPWESGPTLTEIDKLLGKILEIEQPTDFDIRAKKNLLLKKSLIESNRKTYDQFGLSNDHLIHGDYIIPNVFFDEHDKVSYVFDWEKTEYSSRFIELFRSLIQCTLFDMAHSKIYLDAYLAIYPAAKKDLENGIDAYCLDQTHSLWIEDEHYMKGNYRADELLESNNFKIDYFTNHLEGFKKKIFK